MLCDSFFSDRELLSRGLNLLSKTTMESIMVWPGTSLPYSIFVYLENIRILLVGKAIQFSNDLLSEKFMNFHCNF